MSRPNPTVLFGFFVAIIVAMCGVSILKGGLYLRKHEGDTLHLVQIVLRMSEGQWPHLDFLTPVGALAFAPIVLFVNLGYGLGSAILFAQTLVIVALLPAIWWVAYSRLRGVLPYFFGFVVVVLVTSLVHGESERSVSVSMYYNRWAWALAFVAIVAAVLPVQVQPRQNVDGVVIGLAMTALVLTKITYFAAFIIPVVIALLLYRSFRTLFVAAGVGLVVLIGVTLVAGIAFWPAYLHDLLVVMLGDVRSAPGETFISIMGAPAYIGGSLALLFGVIFLRQSGEANGGLLLLLLAPGFFFVAYQNFGNDPQWLLLLAILLFAFLPEKDLKNGFGWDLRLALTLTAAMALAMTAPSFLNLAYSPFRHLSADTEEYVPLLSETGVHSDLQVSNLRRNRIDAHIAKDRPASGLERYAELSDRNEATMLNGEALPLCALDLGMIAWFEAIARNLDQAGLADGKQVFTTDIISSHWLFGPMQPLTDGSPWYYGDLPGIRNADYVLVPLCPIAASVRSQILGTIEERGIVLTEIRRTPLYILFTREGA